MGFNGISAIQWDLTINNRDGIIWPTNNDDTNWDLTNKKSWNRIVPKIRSSKESITSNMELVIYTIPAGDFLTPLNDADMTIEKCWHGKSMENSYWRTGEDVILLREKKMLNDSQRNESWVV